MHTRDAQRSQLQRRYELSVAFIHACLEGPALREPARGAGRPRASVAGVAQVGVAPQGAAEDADLPEEIAAATADEQVQTHLQALA